MKMLKILITPTSLCFYELTDEMYTEFHNDFDLMTHERGYYVVYGTEKELFKILLKLAYTYDIELV